MAEEWVKDTHNEAKAEAHSRFEIEKMVGNLKENQVKLSEQLKEAIRARDSFDAGLKKLRSKLKNNANSCISLKLIWKQRSNW